MAASVRPSASRPAPARPKSRPRPKAKAAAPAGRKAASAPLKRNAAPARRNAKVGRKSSTKFKSTVKGNRAKGNFKVVNKSKNVVKNKTAQGKTKSVDKSKSVLKYNAAKGKFKVVNKAKSVLKGKIPQGQKANTNSPNLFSQASTPKKRNKETQLNNKKQELRGMNLSDLKFESKYVNKNLKNFSKGLIDTKTKVKQHKDKKAEQAEKSRLGGYGLNSLKKMLGSSSKKFDKYLKDLIGRKEPTSNSSSGNCPSGNFGKSKFGGQNGFGKPTANGQSGGSCPRGQGGSGRSAGPQSGPQGGGSPGGGASKKGGGCPGGRPSGGGGAPGGGVPPGGGAGSSKQEGPSQGNDQELQQAHEEAAKDCENLAEKEEKPQGSTKGVVDWKKLAKYIQSNATKAVWKPLNGNAAAQCHSNGKTEYDPKYRGQISKLKEFIVHENTHAIEFKELGDSDENNTYSIHREYGEKMKRLGFGGRGR